MQEAGEPFVYQRQDLVGIDNWKKAYVYWDEARRKCSTSRVQYNLAADILHNWWLVVSQLRELAQTPELGLRLDTTPVNVVIQLRELLVELSELRKYLENFQKEEEEKSA